MAERTLLIIKPDATRRHLTGAILGRLETAGFDIREMRLVRLAKADAERFYKVHEQRPFYDSLTTFMSSGPIVPVMLERENAIAALRELIGATNPAEAACGTVRADWAESIEANSVHGSDAVETAKVELAFFFGES